MKEVILYLTLLSGAFLISGCAKMSSTVKNGHDCKMPDETSVKSLPLTWDQVDLQGIEPRVSTVEDVLEKFGLPESVTPWRISEQQVVCHYRYLQGGLLFWVYEGSILGIEFPKPPDRFPFPAAQVLNLPSTVEKARELYGCPEIVDWHRHGGGYRTVIWISKGVLLEVGLNYDLNDSRILRVIYIGTITDEEFQGSLWRTRIPESMPKGDSVYPWPKNPFNWVECQ
jgi:hypothetical protein